MGGHGIKKGEIVLMQEYYPFYATQPPYSNDNIQLCRGFAVEGAYATTDTLDNHTTVNIAKEDGVMECIDMFFSVNGYCTYETIPEEYAYFYVAL